MTYSKRQIEIALDLIGGRQKVFPLSQWEDSKHLTSKKRWHTRGLFGQSDKLLGPTNDLKCIMSATNISVTTVQLRDKNIYCAQSDLFF